MKKILMVFVTLLSLASVTYAQRTVSGTVTADNGDPLIGANVVVKGTTTGTVTDVNGAYSLSVPSGATTLVVSYTGYNAQELTIGVSNVLNATLSEGVLLEETVVTALGISRDRKSLGYATSTVDNSTLSQTDNTSLLDALSGRAAGVQINTNSGSPGASSSINIRGFASVTGRTEPLFIVDGIPVNNRTGNSITNMNNPSDDFNRSADYGNQFSDLNPQDIESVSILRGSAATAIYGSRGAAGVILVTTKSGKGQEKLSVDYSGTFGLSTVLRVPHLQNNYGQGWSGLFAYEENGSWGPRVDGQIRRWGNIVDNSQLLKPFSIVENNLQDFLETGYQTSHSIGVSGGSKSTHFRIGYGYDVADGIIPGENDKLVRNNINLNTGTAIGKFSAGLALQFGLKNLDAVATGQGDDAGAGKVIWQEIIQVPRDHAIVDYKDYNNKFYNLDNFHTRYATNPYFVLGETGNNFEENRILGSLLLGYDLTQKIKLNWRVGGDFGNANVFEYGNVGIINDNSPNGSANDVVGKVGEANISNKQYNSDVFATYKTDLGSDFDFDFTLGHNANQYDLRTFSTEVTNLSIPGYYSLSNTTVQPVTNTFYEKRRIHGVYGLATLGYKKWLYLGLQGRNDWSSTLPKDNNSFFYPGVTLTGVLSDAFTMPEAINFLKLRLAYAFTGNDAPAYRIDPVYGAAQARAGGFGFINFPIGGVNSFEVGDRIGNPTLKPEITNEKEFGVEAKFWKSRVGLDFSWYDKRTEDQIIEVDLDPTSGYRRQVVNLGEIQNTGIELSLQLIPVRTTNFEWGLDWNFAKNENEILSLGLDSATSLLLNDAYNVELRAEVGKPVGTIYTPDVKRNAAGQIVVNPATGLPLQADAKVYRGHINPDYLTGLGTHLRFKNLTLRANADYKPGGLFYSYTARLNYFVGNAYNSQYNDREPWIIPGSVIDNGDGTFSENTTPISRSDVFTYYGATPSYEYNHLLDKTVFKMRNVSLTWSPNRKCDSGKCFNIDGITLWGRNLALWTPSENHFVDPESNTFGTSLDRQLGEFSSAPSTASYGVTLNIKY